MQPSLPAEMPRREPVYAEVLIRPNVRVPMRDGVKLATDVYLPATGGKVPGTPLPAILQRTPYNKGPSNNTEAMRLARRGYVVVQQDVRGRFESEGEFAAMIQEAMDGYDTVEWVAALPECDGRVGMRGSSYSAFAISAAATQSPPHLAAMSHYFGYPHGYHTARQGGALDLFWETYFIRMAGDGKEALGDATIRQALLTMYADDWLRRWPLHPGRSPLALAPPYERLFFDFLRHEAFDEYWLQPGLSPAAYLERWPKVPTLWICGWYDHYSYCHPDTLAFSRLIELGHAQQYVVWGPWTHGDTGLKIGETTFGPESTRDAALPDYELRWFDRWLKGIDDEGVFRARARYFVMGGGSGARTPAGLFEHGGRWAEADVWPPPDAETIALYLRPTGQLGADRPESGPAATTFRADPADPAPTSTGVSYTVTRLPDGTSKRSSTNGGWDQVEGPHLYGATPPFLPLAARADTLVFQTEPLPADLTVVGHPVVELWVSSDVPDADFVAKLIDVYPPAPADPRGFALGVSEGIQRAKFRDGFERAELMEPGKIYRIRVLLRPLANLFKRGHRLRLDLTSSSWPNFDVNTQTGRNPSDDFEKRVGHHTIHHGAAYASRLVLPTVRVVDR